MSKIHQILDNKWRNIDDYSIEYVFEEGYVTVAITINKAVYTYIVIDKIYNHLFGSDEIIFHKNLLDLVMVVHWFYNPTCENAIRYLQQLIIAPCDMYVLGKALEEYAREHPDLIVQRK